MQATFFGLREWFGNKETERSPASYGSELAMLFEKVHEGEVENDHWPPEATLYIAIVDEVVGRINFYLIEIESE